MKRRLNKKQQWACILAVSALLGQSSVYAAEEEVPEEYSFDQVVVTATRTPQKVSKVAGDVSVISAVQLEQKGAHTLADALEGIPGVSVMQYGGRNSKATPIIYGSDRVVVMMDGKRLNLPQGIAVGGSGFDINTVLLGNNVERIEVVRGGGSTLYGADAVGGVINIITKKNIDEVKSNVVLEAGSQSSTRYALNTQGRANRWSWQVNGVQDKTDGQRPNSDYKGKDVNVRLTRDLSDSENLTFTWDYHGDHGGMPGKMNKVGGQYQWGTSAALTDYSEQQRHNWGVEYNKQEEHGKRMLRYYKNEQIYSGYNWGDFKHTNTVEAWEYQQDHQADAKHLLTWGGEHRKEEVISSGEGNIPHERKVTSVYLQDSYQMNTAWNMTTGLRYDDNSQYGKNWLPKVAFNYEQDARTNYFVSWAKVAKAPNFDDLYWEDPYMKGNPNLKAEHGWTMEAGVKKQLGIEENLTLTLFKQELTDAIRWKDDYSTTENLDSLKNQGVTLAYNARLSPVLTTDVNYTYTDSRKNGTERLSNVPYHAFNVGLHYKQGKFSQSLYGYYLSDKGENSTAVGSHLTVNTKLNYQMTASQSLYLNVMNLFNKQYQTISGYPGQERMVVVGMKQVF